MSTRPRRPAPATPAPGKVSLPDLIAQKATGIPIVMITAYDAPSGQVAAEAGVDVILVGDSAAMTVLGHDSTMPITVDEMIVLTAATTRGSSRAERAPLVVADLPFMSFQPSDRDAILAAGRFVKEAGADAVKVEGAGPTLSRMRAITGAGIPVMGHLGLTPQSATALGGFRAQGRTAETALQLVDEAIAVESAGAFALVLECVPAEIAAAITERVQIPTIGIGAGNATDGQVLVWHDLLGIGAGTSPRFVERYANLHLASLEAIEHYVRDVRTRAFPAERHTYAISDAELVAFQSGLGIAER
ncbi:MAG: 3-methyl-2-oxobutanoate hydroxymethyltransferase [Thermoleophilia bacterium]|nr:3-methyl-2-oxobutanoate hydroxymethyltransferase [Thermoleophilia bacterium]PHX80574.1 MAG: 3-methyl-2-oxobutanoate hydroxymethyltransferase [Thermoleophilia bacterium]